MTDAVLMIAGQSNGRRLYTEPVAGCAPASGTYVLQSGAWRAMTSSDGAGMIEIANALRAASDNVYVYGCCSDGSSVVPEATDPAHPLNCWVYGGVAGSPIFDCEAQVSAGGKIPQYVIWVQGEAEVSYSWVHPSFDIGNAYKGCIDQVRSYLLGQWGVTAAQCTWMVTPVGLADSERVVQAQQEYATSTAGVFYGPPRDDLALVDGVHLTADACRTFGARIAQGIKDFETMTDPQDKAAIASLQAELASIKNSLTGIGLTLGAIQCSLRDLQYPVTNLGTRLSAMEVIARGGPIGPYGTHGYSC